MASDSDFIPHVPTTGAGADAHRPAPGREDAARVPKPTPAGALQYNDPTLEAAEPPSLARTATGSPESAKKRYGPYPQGGRSVAPEIRRWLAAHPNERFMD